MNGDDSGKLVFFQLVEGNYRASSGTDSASLEAG